jgi:hypothetical protein
MEAPMKSFFIVFAHPRDPPGPPTVHRGDDGKVTVYDTGANAEVAAARLTATNKHQNRSFTVTEFQSL